MSQLSEHIKAVQTRQRHIVRTPVGAVLDVTVTIEPESYRMAYLYRMEAAFRVDMVVQEDEAALSVALESARRQIVYAVFGEFRDSIMAIEHALFCGDTTDVLRLLRELEQKMFEV